MSDFEESQQIIDDDLFVCVGTPKKSEKRKQFDDSFIRRKNGQTSNEPNVPNAPKKPKVCHDKL